MDLFTNDVMKRNNYCARPDMLAKTCWQRHRNVRFLASWIDYHRVDTSCSEAELEEMLCELKKTDLLRLGKKSGLKASKNKPELLGRVLELWRSDSSAGRKSTGTAAVTLLVKARAILEQVKDWTKVLTGLSDFSFIDIRMRSLCRHVAKTFHRESLNASKPFESQ